MHNNLALTETGSVLTANILTDSSTEVAEAFARFLRLHVAEGDASPATVRTYHAQAGQFVAWCQQQSVDPATATEEDILAVKEFVKELGGI